MTKYIRLRYDLSVPLWKAIEMMNTPVRFTCLNDAVDTSAFKIDEREDAPVVPVFSPHQWDSNLLLAEIEQNRIRCPVCGATRLSFKRLKGTMKPEYDEKKLNELLGAL